VVAEGQRAHEARKAERLLMDEQQRALDRDIAEAEKRSSSDAHAQSSSLGVPVRSPPKNSSKHPAYNQGEAGGWGASPQSFSPGGAEARAKELLSYEPKELALDFATARSTAKALAFDTNGAAVAAPGLILTANYRPKY